MNGPANHATPSLTADELEARIARAHVYVPQPHYEIFTKNENAVVAATCCFCGAREAAMNPESVSDLVADGVPLPVCLIVPSGEPSTYFWCAKCSAKYEDRIKERTLVAKDLPWRSPLRACLEWNKQERIPIC